MYLFFFVFRAKKSHEVYHAMEKALQSIEDVEGGNLPSVPIHLRNATSKLDTKWGYGKGYTYDLTKNQDLQYMPDGMENVNFFTQ